MIINSADSIAAYHRFVQRVLESKSVWLVVETDRDLPVTCASNDDMDTFVVPVWSDRAYAVRAQPKFAFNTDVEEVSLKNFLERTIPFLSEQNGLTGPNWNADLAGLEVDPLELLEKLQ
ncbi:DUF2750 domain-containing protein [Candidatus Rhodobacter oscarellae]|uniref:DUF2750 domain-containing protein n=1 Tax=Candidatus Rhodobacter oscarellae TaxID=1675527 RepID=UPI001F43103F|nr:DUF2750 domain-containing protein [Candidatus Rhodobacter lobularis]